MNNILKYFFALAILSCASCAQDRADIDYWKSELEKKAFKNNKFNFVLAKRVIEQAPENVYVEVLNGGKAPVGVGLVVLLHMDERVTVKEKKELYWWCVRNKDKLEFDIEKFSAPVTDHADTVSDSQDELVK